MTVAEHVDVCAVVMEEGATATLTPVTVGWMPGVAMAILAVPDFVLSCVEVALIVSEPDAGSEAGAV